MYQGMAAQGTKVYSPIYKKVTGAGSPRYKIVHRAPSLRSKNVPRAASPGYMYVPASGYIHVIRAASPITEVY